MQQGMPRTHQAFLIMQIGMNTGAFIRETYTELDKTSSPAFAMAARVLGEFCIRCGRKPLQSKSMANDHLRASLPAAIFFGQVKRRNEKECQAYMHS